VQTYPLTGGVLGTMACRPYCPFARIRVTRIHGNILSGDSTTCLRHMDTGDPNFQAESFAADIYRVGEPRNPTVTSGGGQTTFTRVRFDKRSTLQCGRSPSAQRCPVSSRLVQSAPSAQFSGWGLDGFTAVNGPAFRPSERQRHKGSYFGSSPVLPRRVRPVNLPFQMINQAPTGTCRQITGTVFSKGIGARHNPDSEGLVCIFSE